MELLIGLLAVSVALFNSFRQAYVKKLTEDQDVVSLTFLIMLYATLIISPFFLYSLHNMESFPSFGALAFGLLSGAFGIGKTLSSIKALEKADLSIADPFLKLSPLIVFVGELLVLQINLSLYIISGVLMAVLGSFIVSIKSGSFLEPMKSLENKGVRYAIYATLFAAGSTLSIKFASLSIDPYLLTGLWYISGLSSIGVYLYASDKLPESGEYWDLRYPFVGVYSGALGITVIYLYSVASATVISAIMQFSVLPSVLIGGRLFAEENILRKLVGGILIVIGTAILILL